MRCFVFFYEEYTASAFMKVLSNWSLRERSQSVITQILRYYLLHLTPFQTYSVE